MDEKKLIKVLLADDTLIAREGWKAILGTSPAIEVVGEAETAQEVPRKVNECSPDVLLMDLKWFGDPTAGWTTIRGIKKSSPKVKVIAITAYEDLIADARRAGADAALTKEFSRDQLINLIKELATSEIQIPKPEFLEEYKEGLTAREAEVFKLLAQGFTDKEIAHHLTIAESTAKNHVKNILSKLNAKNRTEAVAIAREQGLLR